MLGSVISSRDKLETRMITAPNALANLKQGQDRGGQRSLTISLPVSTHR